MMSTLDRYYKTPPPGAYQTQCVLLENAARKLYKPPDDDKSFYAQDSLQAAILPQTPLITTLVSRKIAQDFNESVNRYEHNERVGLVSVDVVSGFMQGALAFGGGPIGGVIAVGIATATPWLKEIMTAERFSAARDKLAIDLSKFREEHNDFSAFSVGDEEGKGKRRYELLFNEESHPVLSSEFDNISDEGRALVQGTFIRMLADADTVLAENDRRLWDELADQGDRLRERGIKIADLERSVTEIDRRFIEFRKSTETALGNIESNVAGIRDGLSSVQDRIRENESKIRENERRIAQNSDDIEGNRILIQENRRLIQGNRMDVDYLQEYLYGKMNPKEQINALKRGFFPGMSESERSAELEKIAIAEKRQELADNMIKYMDGAKDLLGIAGNLGIDLGEEVGMAVEAGSTILNAGLSFASGNFLGALNSLTSLAGLGKKKVDVGAERHKQVMTALGQLAQGQNKILGNQGKLLNWAALFDQRLDQVIGNQRAMYGVMVGVDRKLNDVLSNQRDLFKNIFNLSNQLEKHHQIVMEQLAKILNDLALVRFEMRAGSMEEVGKCETALEQMQKHDRYIFTENRFQSYQDVLGYYSQCRDLVNPALEILTTKVLQAGSASDVNFFHLHIPNAGVEERQKKDAADQYRELKNLAFAIMEYEGRGDLNPLLNSLIHPVNTVEALMQKIDLFEDAELPERIKEILDSDLGAVGATIPRLLVELYNTEAVVQMATYVFRLHYLHQYYSGGIGSDFLSFEELEKKVTNKEELSLLGKLLLEGSMVRIDVALAQQSLVGGDWILPSLLRLFEEGRTDANAQLYDGMIKAFNNSAILAKNFLMYSFHLKAKDKIIDYEIAFHQTGNATKLRDILGDGWNFLWREEEKLQDSEGSELIVPARWLVQIGERMGENGLEVPDPISMKNGKLLTTSEIQRLLSWRKHLAQEIVGYSYANTLNTDSERETFVRGMAFSV
ncbi:MAG: hypothetical protein SNF33_05505 [Candidatus Algichlamydia australiensis]|nr:hypothetical protein [Chlamydiales bacterium]